MCQWQHASVRHSKVCAGDAADKMDILGRLRDISLCPLLKKGGHWNTIRASGINLDAQHPSPISMSWSRAIDPFAQNIREDMGKSHQIRLPVLCLGKMRSTWNFPPKQRKEQCFLYALCWTVDQWANVQKRCKARKKNETDGKQETDKD